MDEKQRDVARFHQLKNSESAKKLADAIAKGLRVDITKDFWTEGYHVFLDDRVVCGGDAVWCNEVGDLLKAGIAWNEEHDGGPKGGPDA